MRLYFIYHHVTIFRFDKHLHILFAINVRQYMIYLRVRILVLDVVFIYVLN